MSGSPMDVLRERARREPKRIIYPEAYESNVVMAAREVADLGVARPVLLGERGKVFANASRCRVSVSDIDLIDPTEPGLFEALVEEITRARPEVSLKAAQRRLRSPLNMAAALLAVGRADAMVAGLTYTTEDVILASMTFVGLEAGLSTPSSVLVMRIPDYDGSEGELIAFADCGVVVSPDSSDLADIAVTTAKTVRTLFGWEPRVAMLSYSTKGSGYDDSVGRVLDAVSLAHDRAPHLKVDGELQVDAAIVPGVAARKVPDESDVAGMANVLIFPDLNAGNIAYKCVQRFARADAYGPLLQGFEKTVSDLSRGSSVADIVGVTTMACVHAQREEPGLPAGKS